MLISIQPNITPQCDQISSDIVSEKGRHTTAFSVIICTNLQCAHETPTGLIFLITNRAPTILQIGQKKKKEPAPSYTQQSVVCSHHSELESRRQHRTAGWEHITLTSGPMADCWLGVSQPLDLPPGHTHT